MWCILNDEQYIHTAHAYRIICLYRGGSRVLLNAIPLGTCEKVIKPVNTGSLKRGCTLLKKKKVIAALYQMYLL